jgi:glutamate--cysteine ligase
LLQLENEFYATIRPKRVGEAGQRPLQLLKSEGIQYIEVRALDLNPFLPVGIDSEQVHFLDAFLLYCLLADSPACDRNDSEEIEKNLALTVNQGRQPGLELSHRGSPITLKNWARILLEDIQHSAHLLDHAHQSDKYSGSLQNQQAKVEDPDQTPSARVLTSMAEQGIPFCRFGMQESIRTCQALTGSSLQHARLQEFRQASIDSLDRQLAAEANDKINFDEFLLQWNDYKI